MRRRTEPVIGHQIHLGEDTQQRMTNLARLRVRRTELEAQFHMRPSRATAIRLAVIYRVLSEQLVAIFDQEGDAA